MVLWTFNFVGTTFLHVVGVFLATPSVVITRTISLRARSEPLGVGIHTHTLLI